MLVRFCFSSLIFTFFSSFNLICELINNHSLFIIKIFFTIADQTCPGDLMHQTNMPRILLAIETTGELRQYHQNFWAALLLLGIELQHWCFELSLSPLSHSTLIYKSWKSYKNNLLKIIFCTNVTNNLWIKKIEYIGFSNILFPFICLTINHHSGIFINAQLNY